MAAARLADCAVVSSSERVKRCPLPMDRRHPYPLRVVVAAIAAAFTICAAAAERPDDVSSQTEFSAPAAGPSSSVDIEAALARVNATRSRADADPLALEEALTALGDAFLDASQYANAEAAYNEALRLAEQHAGLESERVLAPLLGLGNTLAASGHHQQAVLRLQRALAIQRSQYGLFDLRQQDTLKTLAASLTALDRTAEAQDLMIYRVRTAEKTYGEGSPKAVPAVCDLGDWFAEVGMSPEARMTFQMALNIAGDKESLNAPIIVEPLRGIARTYMRRMSYPESWLRPRSPPRPLRPGRFSVCDGPAATRRRTQGAQLGRRARAATSIADPGGRSGRVDADADRNADSDGRLAPDPEGSARSAALLSTRLEAHPRDYESVELRGHGAERSGARLLSDTLDRELTSRRRKKRAPTPCKPSSPSPLMDQSRRAHRGSRHARSILARNSRRNS